MKIENNGKKNEVKTLQDELDYLLSLHRQSEESALRHWAYILEDRAKIFRWMARIIGYGSSVIYASDYCCIFKPKGGKLEVKINSNYVSS